MSTEKKITNFATIDDIERARVEVEATIHKLLLAFEVTYPAVTIDAVHFDRIREIGPVHGVIDFVELSLSLGRRKP